MDSNQQMMWVVAIVAIVAILAMVITVSTAGSQAGVAQNIGGQAYAFGAYAVDCDCKHTTSTGYTCDVTMTDTIDGDVVEFNTASSSQIMRLCPGR